MKWKEKLMLKLRRGRYFFKYQVATYERVVLIFAIFACVFFTIQSMSAMSRNWKLSAELAEKQNELEVAKLEIEAAEIENEYFASEEFQELEARAHAGKEYAGEHRIALPENSAGAIQRDRENAKEETITKKEYSNFELWMRLIFPKN